MHVRRLIPVGCDHPRTITKAPVAKSDGQNDRQKTERGTGRLMRSTQVFVLDDGGEVITITTAGEKPNMRG